MTNEQLQQLWKETDKNIAEGYKKLRLCYEEGSMTKGTYNQQKSFIDGFVSGWTDLYNRVLSRSTKEDLFGIFDSISRSHPEDSFRSIWEIYCHKFDVDYDTEDFDAKMFDEWVDQKDFLEKSK